MRNVGLVLVCLVAACGGDDGGGDGGDGPACSDPKYGNGTCDLDTTCDMVDVDCVATFETQAEAQAWYEETHASIAPALPATDPLYDRIKPLLDEGWDAYRAVHDLGDLEAAEVQLVIVNPPQIQLAAFVVPFDAERDRAALAVMVEKVALQGSFTDEELRAIMMHELEHTLGLHIVAGVRESTIKFYVAPGTSEPFGYDADDDPMIREDYEDWRQFALVTGHFSDAELGGFPFALLQQALNAFLGTLPSPLPAPCATALQNLNAARTAILGAVNKLDSSLTLTPSDTEQIVARFTAVRDQCVSATTLDAFGFVAQVTGLSIAQVKASLPADVAAQLEGINPVVGLYNWAVNARRLMREIEARFAARTGQPWSRLRYYSTEEAADDSAAWTMKALGEEGNIGISLSKLEQIEAQCVPLVTGNQPIAYGENLVDEHHASCWRGGHYKAIQASDDGPSRVAPRRRSSPPLRRSIFEKEAPLYMN